MAWQNWKSSGVGHRLLWIVCSAVWLFLCLLQARALDLSIPYLPLAVAGAFVFYQRNSPKLAEQAAWIISSLAFGMIVRFPHDHNWINTACGVLALFGIGAFLMMGLRWLWSSGSERRRAYAVLAPAGALVFFVLSAQRALSLANLIYPKTYDLYLYLVDGSFGFQPSFLAGRAMAASSIFRIAALLTYVSLPFVMAMVYALRIPKNAERPSWDLITLFLLAGVGGWALYNLVPATGPGYIFKGSFPFRTLPYSSLRQLLLDPVAVSSDIPRNAIPSLHMAWVVLLYWNSKGLSRALRIFLACYTALTVFSTMGTGEHYFVDLVAAVPFALFVQSLVSPAKQTALKRRAISAGSSLSMALVWMVVARFAAKEMLLTPLIPWTLLAVTGVAVWKIKSWLDAQPGDGSQLQIHKVEPMVLGASAGR
ncbi:MAG: phosphatase PAP2 family protein [Acidobacteriaceae bacterium]|nr:phosphatase PAP2 family protein [Acidobacteriaceae bacterium]